MRPSFRLLRSYRLKRRRLIQPLFDRRDEGVGSIASGCIRIQYRFVSPEDAGEGVPVQVGFAVGKAFGGAVLRNRVKRIMREVYRMNQRSLIDGYAVRPEVLTMMIVCRGRTEDERALREDLVSALSRLASTLIEDAQREPS